MLGAKRRKRHGLAVVLVAGVAGCAGALTHGSPAHRPSRSGQAGYEPQPTTDGAAIVDDASAASSARSDGGSDRTTVPEETDCNSNVRQTHHRVTFAATASAAGVFTVTREFEPRSAATLVCLDRDVRLDATAVPYVGMSDRAVFESLAVQTDGAWRIARLAPSPFLRERPPAPQEGPERRPWASLEWFAGGARILMPTFPPTGGFQIRYAIWTEGKLDRGVRRWSYCGGRNHGDAEDDAPAEMATADAGPGLTVRRDPARGCIVIERPEPPPKALSARYAGYRLGAGAWFWRLELEAPASLPAVPQAPAGPVVFVLDGSRSTAREGGLAAQLAIVGAYLHDVPAADVELVVTDRTARRVFGRLVPAAVVPEGSRALAGAPLKNGSFLDRGAELAAEVLATAGRPGRVILMTDGELRSRFDPRALVAALRRAPAGTIAHLVHPAWGPRAPAAEHVVPRGLDAVSAALGGASYAVLVDSRSPNDAPLAEAVRSMVEPREFESLALHDARTGATFPDALDDTTAQPSIAPGDAATWGGIAKAKPPESLSLTGWIWGTKYEIALRPDPALERILPRLATSETGSHLDCERSPALEGRARADGFLAPGLSFWVPGSGSTDDVDVPRGYGGECAVGSGGGGTAAEPPKPDPLPAMRPALDRCAMVPSSTGPLRVSLEIEGEEVLDVTVQGGTEDDRRCVEEALWAMPLPEGFDDRAGRRRTFSSAWAPAATSTH